MNISPHLLIDAVILSTALTITLVLRAKGNAARQEKGSKWLQKKRNILTSTTEQRHSSIYTLWILIKKEDNKVVEKKEVLWNLLLRLSL